MVTAIVAIAILVYIVSIAVMCHNVVPYDPEWEDAEVKQNDDN